MIRTLVSSREEVVRNITSTTSMLLARVRSAAISKRFVVAALAFAAAFGCNTADAQTWTGSTPSDANGKTVYLYNVGANKFLGKGGHWGTEANLSYEGVPFTLTYTSSSKTLTLTSLVKAEGSTSSNGKLTLMDGTKTTSEHDSCNYFVDSNLSVNNTFSFSGDKTTGYQLSIKSTTSTSTMSGKTYMMLGKSDNSIIGTVENDTDYSKWVIVTEAERRDAFKKTEAANAKPVSATFLMYDHDFARNDNSCSAWKTGINQDGTLSFSNNVVCTPKSAYPETKEVTYYTYTNEHKYKYIQSQGLFWHKDTIKTTENHGETWSTTCQKGGHSTSYTTTNTYNLISTTTETETTSEGYTYYLGNGYIETDTDTDPITGEANTTSDKNFQGAYGKYWTANIHGASGAVQQTLTTNNMVRKGYYRVSCKAFTTSTTGTVRLWAASGSNGDGTSETTSEKYAYTAIPTIDEAPATYVAASQTLENGGQTYDVSVKVYAESTSDLLKFGIYVSGADATAWTCFDDFAIEYLGDPLTVLVLDEDQTSGEYIKNQATNDDDELKTVKLYLHRTMNANTWNSLVLPVSLTVGQVKSAFGDQVRISAFEGATDENHKNRIIFKAISASRDNNDEVAIEKEKLYLVKPTKAMPTEQTAVEFEVPGQTEKAKITDYYTIVGVTYAKAADVNDIDYSLKVEGGKGKETYEGEEDAIQFVGTYVKLGDDNKIPTNSYVLNGNNVGGTAGLWYFRTDETPSKGFRGWLQPTTAEAPTEYEINGVVEKVNGKVNGIAAIDADAKTIGGNVYNLNGQLVRRNAASLDGLAHGVYVVNGKKVVVK